MIDNAPGVPPNTQLNWPAGVALPLILNDYGPAGAMLPGFGFPILQPWLAMNPGFLASPYTNLVVHANDYIISCHPNFNISGTYRRLIITNQLQSSLNLGM